MNQLFLYLSFLISVITFGCSQTPTWNSNNWMQHIADTTRMCKLSIPATHDSGAQLGGEFLQTQDLSIPEQLEGGVRGFDIRLQATQDSLLGVYHATQFQHISWEKDVLPAFLSFLNENPSESLIVSLKCEGGSKEAYRNLLAKSLNTPSLHDKFIWDFSPNITLQACRGKILFIHRDKVMDKYPGALCFNWKDNTTCDITLRGSNEQEAIVSVEDEYQYSSIDGATHKSTVTIQNIKNSSVEPSCSSKWFVSFASATALPTDGPLAFANEVNPQVASFLKKGVPQQGIIMIDFAKSNAGKEIIRLMIKSNLSQQ